MIYLFDFSFCHVGVVLGMCDVIGVRVVYTACSWRYSVYLSAGEIRKAITYGKLTQGCTQQVCEVQHTRTYPATHAHYQVPCVIGYMCVL